MSLTSSCNANFAGNDHIVIMHVPLLAALICFLKEAVAYLGIGYRDALLLVES
jgi:hypothetical protein